MGLHEEAVRFPRQVDRYLDFCLDGGRHGQQRACVHRLCNTAYITSTHTIRRNDIIASKPPAREGCYIKHIHIGMSPLFIGLYFIRVGPMI